MKGYTLDKVKGCPAADVHPAVLNEWKRKYMR